MAKNQKTIGTWILQLALALLFIVSGIWMLTGNYTDVISKSLKEVFSHDIANILRIVYGVILLIAGVFLALRLFVPMGKSIDSVLMIIILICWIIAIALVDVVGLFRGIQKNHFNFLSWCYYFAYDMLVLGAIIKVKD